MVPQGQTGSCWGIGDSERCAANNGGSTLFCGEGRTPKVTYTHLPPLNGAFGKKEVNFSLLDLDATVQSGAEVYEEAARHEFEVFFDKFAPNYPATETYSTTGSRAPNWFFYWCQVAEASELCPAGTAFWGGAGPPDDYGVSPRVWDWKNDEDPNYERFILYDKASLLMPVDPTSSGCVPANVAMFGIDTFVFVYEHEKYHVFGQQRGYNVMGPFPVRPTYGAETASGWAFASKGDVVPEGDAYFNRYIELGGGPGYQEGVDLHLDRDGDLVPDGVDPSMTNDFECLADAAAIARVPRDDMFKPFDWSYPGKQGGQ